MPADLSPVRPGNAERLSRMVQLATTADDGDEPFAAFEALLAAEYPRAHARLALERGHHDFGLPVPLAGVVVPPPRPRPFDGRPQRAVRAGGTLIQLGSAPRAICASSELRLIIITNHDENPDEPQLGGLTG